MAFPASFAELRAEIWPRWAQRPRWASFLGTLHQQMDDVVSRMKWSIGARLVEKAPDDALASIGGNCNLPQPRAMAAAAYRAHLRRPFERWYDSSTPAGLAREIAALGYPRVEIFSWRDLADLGNPGAFGGNASCFFVRIRQPHPWSLPGTWDGGAAWDAAPFTWDSTATLPEIEEIRETIRRHKPAHMTCRFIEVFLQEDVMGNPIEYTRWPMHETWERAANGGFLDFYNGGI